MSPPGTTQDPNKGLDPGMQGMVKQEVGEPMSPHSHSRLVPPLLQVSCRRFTILILCTYHFQNLKLLV